MDNVRKPNKIKWNNAKEVFVVFLSSFFKMVVYHSVRLYKSGSLDSLAEVKGSLVVPRLSEVPSH